MYRIDGGTAKNISERFESTKQLILDRWLHTAQFATVLRLGYGLWNSGSQYEYYEQPMGVP